MNEEINLAAPNQQKNGFILRPSTEEMVTSRRLLNKMEKAGHIAPVPVHCRPKKDKYYYVETVPGQPADFVFEESKFAIKYCDGCFFPFVFQLTN